MIDQPHAYVGLMQPMNDAQRAEAVQTAINVNVDGSVPDPIVGCRAGFMQGDPCSGTCSSSAGSWDSFLASQSSCEFRGGQIAWQGGSNSTCRWQELVPIGSASGSACGTQCFVPSQWGATCPKFGWLQRSAGCVGSSQPEWGPLRGNFYWKFFSPPFGDAVPQKTERDFNGDGTADILWRQTSGTVAVWLMNGTASIGSGVPGTVASDWQIAGVGDFNGDRRADILWRQTSGTVAVWLMNGTALIGSGVPGTVGSDWQIAGVGDFNGDGKADILWRHTSGTVSVWPMNGTALASAESLGGPAAEWQIVRVGDFNSPW